MDLLGRMETFVRVVEAGSFSAAAKQLRLSVAAVSRHVATLEAELQTPLVARTTRRMSLTPAGRSYYERCLDVLRHVDEAQAVGRDAFAGPLRISVPVAAGMLTGELLAPVLADFPGLRIDLRLDDRLLDLALEDVDIALRAAATPPLSTELVAVPLTRWRRIVVAAPRYLRRAGEPDLPADLARHAVLSSGGALSDVWTLERSLNGTTETARLALRTSFSSNAAELVRELVREGHGLALLPDFFVAADLRARRLRRVLRSWTSTETAFYALYRTALRREHRVRAVIDHLRRAFAAGAWTPQLTGA